MTFERQVTAGDRGTPPQRPHQALIQTPRTEQRALDQHLPALFGRRARRDEYDMAVGVRRLAAPVPARPRPTGPREGGEEPEPVRSFASVRSRPGQHGVDEFAEGAHDLGVVGQDLDDGRLDGAAQAEPFGDQPAGEDQHPGGGHLSQR